MITELFTIGYEGLGIETFVARLREHGVETLVDVRELPLSRKAGFSKTALAQRLAEAGIGYDHQRALGSPRPMRHRLRADGDLAAFFERYRHHLNAQQTALDRLLDSAAARVVLMCYERDPGC